MNSSLRWVQPHLSTYELLLVNYTHILPKILDFFTSLYGAWFVDKWILPFDLGGTLGKVFHFDPPYATIVGFMVRPWSRTQADSQDEKRKSKNRPLEYLQLICQATDLVVWFFQEVQSQIFTVFPEANQPSTDGRVSSFERSGKGGQPIPIQLPAETSPHNFQGWPNELIISCAQMWLHTEVCAVFARNFINEISVILDKHCNFNVNDENKDKTFIQWYSSQLRLVKYPTYSNTDSNSSL